MGSRKNKGSVMHKREKEHNGVYHTKCVILGIYDAMQQAIATVQPYQTFVNPPPADPRCWHPPKETNG
jgi:hypothetical protein